jgi:hypothetical protein
MTKFVPYLADEMIEGDAALLLAEYAHARGIVIAPPIPGRFAHPSDAFAGSECTEEIRGGRNEKI